MTPSVIPDGRKSFNLVCVTHNRRDFTRNTVVKWKKSPPEVSSLETIKFTMKKKRHHSAFMRILFVILMIIQTLKTQFLRQANKVKIMFHVIPVSRSLFVKVDFGTFLRNWTSFKTGIENDKE